MQSTRENDVFLPGARLKDNVAVSNSLAETVEDAEIVLG